MEATARAVEEAAVEIETCNTFWGSHGCDLPAGHDPTQEHPIHVCFVRVYGEDGEVVEHDYCQRAQYVTAESSRVSYMQNDEETWSEWHEGFGALFRNDEGKIR